MATDHRSFYDSAMFWVAFGAAVTAVGGIVLAVGVAQVVTAAGADLWSNRWFDLGLAIVIVGVLMLLWGLTRYLAHHRGPPSPLPPARTEPFWRRRAHSSSDAVSRLQRRIADLGAEIETESFDAIRLDANQTALLRALVKANNVAKRVQPFAAHATLTIGLSQSLFGPPSYYSLRHPGLPKGELSAARLDLEALAHHKLIVLHQTTAFGSPPTLSAVDLMPLGVDYARKRL